MVLPHCSAGPRLGLCDSESRETPGDLRGTEALPSLQESSGERLLMGRPTRALARLQSRGDRRPQAHCVYFNGRFDDGAT